MSKFVGAIVLILLVIGGCKTSEQTSPPNIILIMADDLGYGDLGSYGSERMHTPNIDFLANEGIRLTDYHSNGSVCTPTRAALLTGRYQQRSCLEGVIYVKGETRQVGMDSDEITIAEVLKEAGYDTGIFGKWHLGYKKEYNPIHQGFDEFYGYVSGNIDFHSHYDNAGIYDWWYQTDSLYEEGYSTDLITDHTVAFIQAQQDRPFFAYVAHEAPHVPFQGRSDTAYRFPGREFTYYGPVEDRDRAYKDMIEEMDEGIGKIIDAVEEAGISENTLIIFCSDNGAIPTYGDNGQLRGTKTTLWEGGHRVPGIFYWKGKITPGVFEATMLSMDLYPTIASIAGVDPDKYSQVDGMDMSPHILENESVPSRTLFWRYRGNAVAREGQWKLAMIDGDTMLFDLDSDLGEQHDISDLQQALTQQLLEKYLDWENEVLEGVKLKTN